MRESFLLLGTASCLVLSALLAAASTLLGLGRHRLRALAARHAVLRAALERPRIITRGLHLGSALALVATASLAAAFAERLRGRVDAPPWLSSGMELAAVAALVLVVGELVPRTWAASHPERLLPWVSPVLGLVRLTLGPFATLLSGSSTRSGGSATVLEDLPLLAEPTDGESALRARERAMFQGALRLRAIAVRELMTPLGQLVMAEGQTRVHELIRLVRENWHSRIPVYEGRREGVRGVLYAKDLLPFTLGGDDKIPARALMREAYFVPTGKRADELLADFQREHLHAAVVVDEYGRAQGLVTLEDVLEEIVGEVRDEFDVEEPALMRLEDGAVLARGGASLGEVQRVLGVHLPGEAAETLEGYLLRLRPGGLARGEEVHIAGQARFRVECTVGDRIWTVRAEREGAPR